MRVTLKETYKKGLKYRDIKSVIKMNLFYIEDFICITFDKPLLMRDMKNVEYSMFVGCACVVRND